MILNITSYPRSGNSFFTTTMLQFGKTWKHKNPAHRGLTPVTFRPVARLFAGELDWFDIERAPWHDEESPVAGQERDKNPTRYIEDTESVYVYKRHDNPDDYVGPRIYLVRDGRDVLLSYAQHRLRSRMLMENWENQEEIASMEIPIELLNAEANDLLWDVNSRWGYWVMRGAEHPDVKAVVKYERLLLNPTLLAQSALAHCDYIVSKISDAPDFAKLQKLAPQFYWRGKAGGHTILHPDIISTFTRLNREALDHFCYL